MEPDARKQVDSRSKRRAGSPKRPSAGNLSAGISTPGKKKCSPFLFLPLIMNKLLSSPLGTKEQNSKEECRRHFIWMSATDPERKETQSRQVPVWLSAWSIMRCVTWGCLPSPGAKDPPGGFVKSDCWAPTPRVSDCLSNNIPSDPDAAGPATTQMLELKSCYECMLTPQYSDNRPSVKSQTLPSTSCPS